MKKLILILFVGLAASLRGYAQSSASDPDINILMIPYVLFHAGPNSVGNLQVSTCNNGNLDIIHNSLRITVSIGTNAEIMGIGAGSDPRWTVLTMTTGVNNTIQLKNTGGTMTQIAGANPCATINLVVQARFAGGPSTITGTIGYIAGINPDLIPPAPNASQGNSSTANDNSTTSVIVPASILPVTLVSFNAVVNNCVTTLNWKSGTELNFKNYEVQYSKDGVNFETISVVNGQGDNSSYSKVHSPAQGKAYYRLKSVDNDNRSAYSQVIALNISCGKGSILVYPNPARDVLNVNVTGADANGTMATLFNVAGQTVLSMNLSNGSNQLDISRLSRGIYQLRLINNSGTENIKVVID
jgi:hypothetical protein